MRAGHYAGAFFFLFFGASTASATNPGFLPGDCCFLTNLTQEKVKDLQNSNSPTFSYKVPDPLSMAFCGYSGYWRLEIPDMPQAQRAALKAAYESAREFQPRELTELKDSETGRLEVIESNPLRVLVVNRDFDFKRYGVLGKYNEAWPKESLAGAGGFFGGGSGSTPARSYVPIVQNAEIVIQEWYHGSEVAPLAVELPAPLEATVGGKPVLQPAKAKKPLRFIVLPERFESYVKPEDGTSLYVVDDDVVEYRYHPGDRWLKAADWEKKQDGVEEHLRAVDAQPKSPPSGW
ncbi:hypothetical protein Pan44_00800 [Caulifigura coniformis]|uniref:Uncharacterized protein n=1 Tax=Caulifigura coniformis TaxID=2527983 RepID=A0A517S7H4_9PLAN|nr:hypothetical protein [Caulifigura coniformis]QDT52072.1 hypothetical protein Pan44_00800 [Caulifigura coniformis]